MDIQSRKILFVQEFLKLQSEKTISQLEKLLKKETENSTVLNPMSIEQYHNRINSSIADSKNGRVVEAGDLISEIEKWS